MSFNRIPMNAGKEIIQRYQDAKIAYAAACRRITKLRLAAEHPLASDTEIATYARARKAHKAECAVFQNARVEFMHASRALATPVKDERDEKYLNALEDLTMEQLQEMKKKALMDEEIASGKYDDIIEHARNYKSTKEQFLESPEEKEKSEFSFLDDMNKTKGENEDE